MVWFISTIGIQIFFWKEEFDAEIFLLEKYKEIKQLIHVIDYVPTQVAVSEGLVVKKN